MFKNSSFKPVVATFRVLVMVVSVVMLSACATSSVHSSKSVRASVLNNEATKALLATIPDSHPQRSELRRIVMQPTPEGFTAAEWLRLSMKFDVNPTGSRFSDASDN